MTSSSGQTIDEQIKHVWNQIDPERLKELIVELIEIPSPTGQERALAEWAVKKMSGMGLGATLQVIDEEQANAIGRITGDSTGVSLLLYAPIDTLTTGNPEEDVPWIGPELREDMKTHAVVDGNFVLGLGASNPKGHAACIIAAAEVIVASGVELRGDLIVGLGAGGMPTNKRANPTMSRYNAGQGNGCSFMIEQGVFPDFALIAKPGWAVAWEEVGLCWFEVQVGGTFNYVGSRHRMPYVNPIVESTKVIVGLEEWFKAYSSAHTDGLVAPQGNIGAIRSGWMHMPSVCGATCSFMVDLRTSPRSTPSEVRREFAQGINDIRSANPELDITWEMVLSIPGTSTNPSNWIVESAVRAWEKLEGRGHEPILLNSGATDANILRGRGIPTARIGMDRIGEDAPLTLDFAAGMNVVDVREMVRLTKHLVHTALDTCNLRRDVLD